MRSRRMGGLAPQAPSGYGTRSPSKGDSSASTTRPKPNIAVTKCKVAASFRAARPKFFELAPNFAVQSGERASYGFWVVIIRRIVTQQTAENLRDICSPPRLELKSTSKGRLRAVSPRDEPGTLHLVTTMLGLGRVASDLGGAAQQAYGSQRSADHEAVGRDFQGGGLP